MSFLPMAKIAFRNLLTRPATRLYPKQVREAFPSNRGRIAIDYPDCIFCGACSKRCPAASIKVDREVKVWSIDRFSCVTCGLCVRVCPKKCLYMRSERSLPLAFADIASAVEAHGPEAGTGKSDA